MSRFTLNDRPVDFQLDPQMPLLWALREAANLTSVKYGCGSGECGACLVLVDGQALPSCQITLAEAEGRVVMTVEALSRGHGHAVQRALVEEQAIQCGYCTPGIVIAGVALLQSNFAPSDADIKSALSNMCRCGVYPRLIRAIRRAADTITLGGEPDTAINAAPETDSSET